MSKRCDNCLLFYDHRTIFKLCRCYIDWRALFGRKACAHFTVRQHPEPDREGWLPEQMSDEQYGAALTINAKSEDMLAALDAMGKHLAERFDDLATKGCIDRIATENAALKAGLKQAQERIAELERITG